MIRMSSMSLSAFLIGQVLLGSAAAQTQPDGVAPVAPPPPAPSVAQAVSGAGSDTLQTVTVTAQKRSETVKEIPFSISAIGGGDLADNNIVNIEDITRQLPGVSFQAGAGQGRDIITMRGISSQGGNATVGIYLDDVPAQTQLPYNSSYSGATEPKLFDIARVEVLRGPQMTLYGAGSMGGAIRYITNQPDLDSFSGVATSDLGGTEHGSINYEEQGVVNVPILPGVLAFRGGIDYSYQSGWIDRYAYNGPTQTSALEGTNTSSAGPLIDSGTNSTRVLSARMAVLYRPDDQWSVTASLLGQRLTSDDTDLYYEDIGLYKKDSLVPERNKDTMFVPSVTVTDDLGFADLTSITSYFWRQNARITDSTYYNSDFFEYLADFVYTAPRAQGRHLMVRLRRRVRQPPVAGPYDADDLHDDGRAAADLQAARRERHTDQLGSPACSSRTASSGRATMRSFPAFPRNS